MYLKQAVAEVAQLSDEEQNAFAVFMLQELKSEERWNKLFALFTGDPAQLATEVIEEYKAGRTKPLDPDQL
ncbi:MAG: hypothetical protein J4G05_10555 [Chlorobi bacterium]|nr:hypothetical protein [Chlorobiota bacterium]